MKRFLLKKEKLVPLTQNDIKELGWNQLEHPSGSNVYTWFGKNNYFLRVHSLQDETPIIHIVAKDPSLIDWMPDPEQFRVSLRCPTREHFEIITSLL